MPAIVPSARPRKGPCRPRPTVSKDVVPFCR